MAVAGHYGKEHLVERLLHALGLQAGEPLTMDILAQADEFHLRGAQSTLELLELAELTAGEKVVDLGSGLGGPARKIAFHRKCEVTGVDLTREFVDAATELTRLVGLSGVSFQVGDACSLPFRDGAFDVAWTQHTSMNIADKGAFYQEARRIVGESGRFAFFDILAGSGELAYPVPWAPDASISHLATVQETKGLLSTAGFEIKHWRELTEECTAWLERALPSIASHPNLPLAVVNEPDVVQKFDNLLSNLMRGRVKVVMGTADAV